MIDDKGDEIICRAEKNKLLPMMMEMGEAMNIRIQNNLSNTQVVLVDGRYLQMAGGWVIVSIAES